ncbi:MAG: hypothetical protein HY242_09165 [Afipia sp.]|nr:hypothetical protein [Afipia sp.]
MRNLIAASFVFSLIAGSAAFAQTSSSGTLTKSPSTSSPPRVTGSAPVGHRQPTAADVGNPQNPAELSPEEKALDRKIKSICRGC